ncbi:MAG: hypothetical protein SGBAC_011316 [Bacillariaceae sp.]
MKKKSTQFDLSEIGLREQYKLNLLSRLGGKVKFYLKVAKFCEKIHGQYELAHYFETYDLKELHRCLVDILNAAFQELPELFDLKTHFQARHQKLIDAGMTAIDFDIFVFIFEATLWETTSADEALITDAVNLLLPLRNVFNVQQSSNNKSEVEEQESKSNGPSIWELVEQRKQEKIESRRAKLQRSQSKRLSTKSYPKKAKTLLEESQRSVSTEEMTVLSADELLCETNNWESSAYQSWNNVV